LREATGLPFGSRLGRQKSAKSLLEEMRLILIVEADLKADAASGVRNWVKRGWLDVAVIQPSADVLHGSTEGTSRLFFDLYDEWGIERHIALLPMSREAGAYGALSWCRVSDWGRTNESTLQDISSAALRYFSVVLSP